MPQAKDQHFLPQFYLRQFVDIDTPVSQEPYVWIFDLSKRRWRRRAPKKVAAMRHYYTFEDDTGQPVDEIESSLSKVESAAAITVRKLLARQPLTAREQLHFSFFVASLAVRTPQNRENTQDFLKRRGQDIMTTLIQGWRENPEEFDAAQRRYRSRTGTAFEMDLEQLEQHSPHILPNDAAVLSASLAPAFALTDRLMGMTWRFYSTKDEDRLVICDHPCDFALPDDVTQDSFHGIYTADAEFHVPLAPNLLFAAHDDVPDRAFGGLLDHEDVVRINRRMVRRAQQFVLSAKPTFPGDEMLREDNR